MEYEIELASAEAANKAKQDVQSPEFKQGTVEKMSEETKNDETLGSMVEIPADATLTSYEPTVEEKTVVEEVSDTLPVPRYMKGAIGIQSWRQKFLGTIGFSMLFLMTF